MELTDAELKRALSLQKRLRFLRWWDKVGKFFCWPWLFYKTKQARWMDELSVLYEKKFNTPEPSQVKQAARQTVGNPLEILRAKQELNEIMGAFGGMYGKQPYYR